MTVALAPTHKKYISIVVITILTGTVAQRRLMDPLWK